MKTKHDDGLEWLREIRTRLAKKFDHSPRKAAAHYRAVQKQHPTRLYRSDEPSDVHAYDALHDRAHSEISAGQATPLTNYRTGRKRKAK